MNSTAGMIESSAPATCHAGITAAEIGFEPVIAFCRPLPTTLAARRHQNMLAEINETCSLP